MSDKVPILYTLEDTLSSFNKQSLKSKDDRFSLLNQLQSAFIFIRDYDKPPPEIMIKATDSYNVRECPEYAKYSPTINHLYAYNYKFLNER